MSAETAPAEDTEDPGRAGGWKAMAQRRGRREKEVGERGKEGSKRERTEHLARSGNPKVPNTACAQQTARGIRATRGSYHVRINAVSSCRARPATPDHRRPDCYRSHCGPPHRWRCAVHGLPTLQC